MSVDPNIYVIDVGRSQIRRTIFRALSEINPANTPANSGRAYETTVQLVTDNWVDIDQIDQLPAILFRFARTEYQSRQSHTLNARLLFEVFAVIGSKESTLLSGRLDALIDDIIAAIYSNYRADGFAYEVTLLNDVELPPTESGKRAVRMNWQTHYTRSYRLDSREPQT